MDEVVIWSKKKANEIVERPTGRREFRGTEYRGVTKNSRLSYQIMSKLQGGKEYLATVDNIDRAAVLSDVLTI